MIKDKLLEFWHRPEIDRELQPKIIGGRDGPKGAYPWYAVPVSSNTMDHELFSAPECGASLVAPDMLLTASHCILAFAYAEYVVIGKLCLENETYCDQEYDIQFIHPDYFVDHQFVPHYDLAVIKLADRSFIDPIPLDQGHVSQSY